MPRPSKAHDARAERVWTLMRDLAASNPPKHILREALDLGRGTGRVKTLIRLVRGPMSLSELADAISVDPPYATLIVDTLEGRGLVERRPDPADRRRKIVQLTASGKDAAELALQIQRQPPPGFGRLSAGELATLEDLVQRIAQPDDAR